MKPQMRGHLLAKILFSYEKEKFIRHGDRVEKRQVKRL